MDARITKQRLANYLSYDWLKMLAAVAAAVALVVVLFLMVSTRVTVAQQYLVYSYGGLIPSDENAALAGKLKRKFSYDILLTGVENFDSGTMGSAAFTARRSVLEGSAIFVADYGEDEGNTPFLQLASVAIRDRGTEYETCGTFYEMDAFMADCEEYLARFFGENWKDAPVLDMEKVRACFLARNGEDKRFKSEEQKEEGVKLEQERLEGLREDYLYVLANGFEHGIDIEESENNTLSYAWYETEGYETAAGHVDKRYAIGINLGKLNRLNKLYYYADAAGKPATQKIDLLFFNNGDALADLKYESVTFLRYLLENYK